MNRILLGGLLGGLMLFIWSAISWMVIPWHEQTFNHFSNESAVAQAIQANAPKSGVYMLPSMGCGTPTQAQVQGQTAIPTQAQAEPSTSVPGVFASVRKEGCSSNMIPQLIISFLIDVLVALLVTVLVAKTLITSYFGRVFFVVLFGLAAALGTYLMFWNWFGFDTQYTLINILDHVIAWFFAGLAIAAVLAPTRRMV